MILTASGVIIGAALAVLALGAAALTLRVARPAGGRLAGAATLLPAALVAGFIAALLLGYRLPTEDLTAYVPIAIGLLTAVLARSVGYGLIAGLVVAVTML